MDYKNTIDTILNHASLNNFPDVHINSNLNIRVRNTNWEIVEINEINWVNFWVLSKLDVKNIIEVLIWNDWYEKFSISKELDTSYVIENWARYRVNCYMDSNWYSIAFRLIPSKIPDLDELWLWDQIKEMCKKWKWLILVTWPTWSWKSTNLASMIDYINKNFKKHIITIEDPIEFSFKSEQSLVNQREIWSHTNWFENAIRASLREDPDVIMIWEMRDPETIKAAITLAETWHLVLSTLHTNDSIQTIDRIVDVFPSSQQAQIRMQFSQSLVWIVSQRLVPRIDKEWRIPAREILISDDAIRNLIIIWKTHHIYSVLEVWKSKWMILMDKYLLALYNRKIISKDSLLSLARDRDNIKMMID